MENGKNVFVVSHKGSLRPLVGWLKNRESFNNFSSHLVDKNGCPFIGLSQLGNAEKLKRGIILIRDITLLEACKKIIENFLEED